MIIFWISAILFLSFMAAVLFTHIIKKKLLAQAVLDQPNERSMHTIPTPRGGGLALLPIFIFGLVLISPFSFYPVLWLLAALGILSLICWRDDKKGVGIGLRFLAHILAAILGCFALGGEATIFENFLPFWLDRSFMIIGWVWFMNLYNFMDGIDGITSTQSFCCAAGVVLIFLFTGQEDILNFTLPALICGACGGFLLFNWYPSKIFLGDVGSIPLGFLIGFLLLKLILLGYPAPALILPLYYLADSGITILTRLWRRQRIWQPHRLHFYQRAALGVNRHDKIVLWILWTNIILICLAIMALFFPLKSLFLSLIIVALLLIKMHKSAKESS